MICNDLSLRLLMEKTGCDNSIEINIMIRLLYLYDYPENRRTYTGFLRLCML